MNSKKKGKFSLSIRLKLVLVIIITVVFSIIGYLLSKNTIAKYANLYENEQLDDYRFLIKTILNQQFEKSRNQLFHCNHPYNYTENNALNTNHPNFGIVNIQDSSGVINLKNVKLKIPLTVINSLAATDTFSYFEIYHNKLYQVCLSQNPENTQKSIGNNINVLIELYTDSILNKLVKNKKFDIKINFVSSVPDSVPNNEIYLYNFNKQPVAKISITKTDAFIDKLKFLNKKLGKIFIILITALSLITLLSFQLLIVKPLLMIETALNQQSDIIARKLMYKRDEFGKMARLIIRFFQQRKLLDDKVKKLSETKEKLKFLNQEWCNTAENLRIANNEIVMQQKAFTDNLYYASAVQRAALIPSINIDKVFTEHFILFKPRDIVSGDFYWFYQLNNKYYVAVADCTGHGLSGSLMSMLGISFLSQIIHNSGNKLSAAAILSHLRDHIIQSLHQQGLHTEVHDGMDIALAIIDFELMSMEFAGANNSLFLVRQNKDKTHDLIAYKGDPMPVGYYERIMHFNNHIISIRKSDSIYLFTDGIIDQFGGPNDKKFLTKNLKSLILDNVHKKMKIQGSIYGETFDHWKANTFQVDDVTLIGLKI